MKTTPIPVKFDRQGHSCIFYWGFGPMYLNVRSYVRDELVLCVASVCNLPLSAYPRARLLTDSLPCSSCFQLSSRSASKYIMPSPRVWRLATFCVWAWQLQLAPAFCNSSPYSEAPLHAICIAAFTSYRGSLSLASKGCREWGVSM